MKREFNLGIGFVTGRPNVCKIINSYYKNVINQIIKRDEKINVTFYILYDLRYQYANREDFYAIIPEVYKENIKITYITPEDIEEENKILIGKYGLTKKEAELFLGHGHAKGRNTVMYYALKENMDYLLFWDDDEYPIANIKGENNTIIWREQDNVSMQLDYIQNNDVTIGYHCGYISPIPYMDYHREINEEILKDYIEAISNDIINWETIKERFEKDNGVTYANLEIAEGKKAYEIEYKNGGKWVAGSTLCINLMNIDKIPAFYNPPDARGEDTFFSTLLEKSRVTKVPVYHFHDGFLKYRSIMKGNYPSELKKIHSDEEEIEKRFLQASQGWIKYKPLLLYISDKENYRAKIDDVRRKLKVSIPEINKLFKNSDFNVLLDLLDVYDNGVEKHYQEYLLTNKIWNNIKKRV